MSKFPQHLSTRGIILELFLTLCRFSSSHPPPPLPPFSPLPSPRGSTTDPNLIIFHLLAVEILLARPRQVDHPEMKAVVSVIHVFNFPSFFFIFRSIFPSLLPSSSPLSMTLSAKRQHTTIITKQHHGDGAGVCGKGEGRVWDEGGKRGRESGVGWDWEIQLELRQSQLTISLNSRLSLSPIASPASRSASPRLTPPRLVPRRTKRESHTR
ncbi:hypothetical protein E2C01_041666 [Portunus trituberculatus]|uniref:Uncharacterized protein n=1 Tax=Portunus trituberculatus TaxID=210409 RepID=A0A5B7FQZ2_PORTR|nr:hypothetical protein [Portunus trituberculatus]